MESVGEGGRFGGAQGAGFELGEGFDVVEGEGLAVDAGEEPGVGGEGGEEGEDANPHFPALRPGPTAGSGAARQKQTSKQPPAGEFQATC